MLRALIFAAALSSIGSLPGQQSSISGPVEGFIFDAPTRSIRAVIGSLGSASLGPAVVSLLDFASIAPGQNYAIGVHRGQPLLVTGLGSAQASVASLPGASPIPEGVAWSRDGSVAVLYSRTGGWIQTFTGFPAGVSGSAPLSVATLGGALSAVAADAHGQTVAIGVTGDHAGVYGLTAGEGSFSALLQISQPAALAFSEDSGTLYAVDGSTNQMWEINLTSSASLAWPVITDNVVAIQAAVDATNQKVLYVADVSSRSLLIYDRATRQLATSLPLSFDPTVLEPLGASDFVLRSRVTTSDPLWSFTNRGQPNVYFVPAASGAVELRHEGPPR